MKKLVLVFATLFSSAFLSAQESGRNPVSTGSGPITPAYANDIIINNQPTVDQRKVKLSVAYNGWLYTAVSTVDSMNGNGGIDIRRSIDNGLTWQQVDAYSVPGVKYEALDIVVAGTDTSSLVLYLVGVNHNISANSYVLFVDRYDATHMNFMGSNYNIQNGTRRIYDVAIASDYRMPGVGSSPYSVAFLYSTFGNPKDSIIYVASVDGGSSFSVKQPVAATTSFYHNVSLAYGKSVSASNGRFFGAWEQMGSSTARTGHIYTSRSSSTISSSWIPPVNLDSVSSTMINLCSNPQIASQFSTNDNDSGSVSSIVLVQRDYAGDGSDYDVLGFYNKRSHYTNFWYRMDIINTSENDMQPDISYDPGYDNFLVTYFDSTNGKLPYVVNGFNLVNTWATISPQYNDATTNLSAPYPRVEINPVTNQTAHAWVSRGIGTMGVGMFDAEYNAVSLQAGQQANGITYIALPNPAVSNVAIRVKTDYEADLKISIYNALGQVVNEDELKCKAKEPGSIRFDVSSLENGVYLYVISDGVHNMNGKFVVAH